MDGTLGVFLILTYEVVLLHYYEISCGSIDAKTQIQLSVIWLQRVITCVYPDMFVKFCLDVDPTAPPAKTPKPDVI